MNQLLPFAQGGMPAHIAAFAQTEANIGPKDTIPQLSTRGKVFRIVVDGQETPLTKVDKDTGETVPVNMVKLIVLDHNKARSRSYYEAGFDPDKPQAPVCWSSDGKVPDESVQTKQSATCGTCPRAVKGSKTTDAGKATTECAQNKRIAVIPASKLDFPALLLRLAVTSIWDKDNAENEGKGYYAWDQYLDFLRQRGVTHTGMVITNVKFDLRKEYPKLVFKASDWTPPEVLAQLTERMGSGATEDNKALIARLLNVPESSVAQRAGDGSANGAAAPTPVAAAPAPAPAPVVPAKPAKPVKPAKAAPAPAPAPVEEEDETSDDPQAAAVEEDDVDIALPPARGGNGVKTPAAAAPKAVPKAAPVTPAASDQKGLAALLGQWSAPAADE